MLTALLQMSLLVACGSIWKSYAPSHIPAIAHRRSLTDLVFYLLLPAMVLDVTWRTPLTGASFQVSFLAALGVVSGFIVTWQALRLFDIKNRQKGALLLAGAFPNVTYLGLPVLDQVLGPETRSTVIQYDLFACTPLLLTLGILMARHYGDGEKIFHPLKDLGKVPPLWAVAIGVCLNLFSIEQPALLHNALSTMAGGVVPLMLIVLGMSIRWRSLHIRYIPLLLPVLISTLVIMPAIVLMMSYFLGLSGQLQAEVVLIAAMPTMVFGVVISERYQLDSELYAAAVTLSTIVSLLTLSLWFHFLVS